MICELCIVCDVSKDIKMRMRENVRYRVDTRHINLMEILALENRVAASSRPDLHRPATAWLTGMCAAPRQVKATTKTGEPSIIMYIISIIFMFIIENKDLILFAGLVSFTIF